MICKSLFRIFLGNLFQGNLLIITSGKSLLTSPLDDIYCQWHNHNYPVRLCTHWRPATFGVTIVFLSWAIFALLFVWMVIFWRLPLLFLGF